MLELWPQVLKFYFSKWRPVWCHFIHFLFKDNIICLQKMTWIFCLSEALLHFLSTVSKKGKNWNLDPLGRNRNWAIFFVLWKWISQFQLMGQFGWELALFELVYVIVFQLLEYSKIKVLEEYRETVVIGHFFVFCNFQQWN